MNKNTNALVYLPTHNAISQHIKRLLANQGHLNNQAQIQTVAKVA
jgi:hypothetical protein